MIASLATIITRDLRLTLWRGGEAWQWVAFFLICVTLFPFALGSDPALLVRIAPGIIWIMALLMVLLSLPMLFESDHADGTLEQYLLLPVATEWWVLAKCFAHWSATALPVILLSPLLCLMYRVPTESITTIMLSLALGTPALTALGALGAGLTLGHGRAGVILSILVLPLCVPVLIFGAAYAQHPQPMLPALSLGLLPISVWLTAIMLRHQNNG